MLCLFQTTQSRASYNFDMYEESTIPEKLPGGGGFSIKNLSLNALYQEHTQGHNIFTHTNTDRPLCRYKGCKIKFYQSQDIDYVATYSNTLPLESSMAMYNSMQPSIHLMQQQKIIVPSKKTKQRKKPYITKFIKPPPQLKDQWYFQFDLCKTPLFMLRTSATTLDHYYIGSRSKSTNITIPTINTAYIQNRDWGNRNTTYWCQTLGTQRFFLYGTHSHEHEVQKMKLVDLIPLINTQDWQRGEDFKAKSTTYTTDEYINFYKDTTKTGNPFYTEWIEATNPVIHMPYSPQDINNKLNSSTTSALTMTMQTAGFTQHQIISPVINLRYNPYQDKGVHNNCYFLPVNQPGHGWDPTGDPKLRNDNLPLWLLLFGYADFVKKTEIIHNVDTRYVLVIDTTYTNPKKTPIVPISLTFTRGQSPYDQDDSDSPDIEDINRWFPQYQYQQEMINEICLTGPGTPRIPSGNTCEAKIKYCFYFKWGGDLPPMSTITDPTTQPRYPIPNNINETTSLQNPETRPEYFLYSFDERRGQITQKAAERITKDKELTELSLLPTEPRFSEKTTIQKTSPETTSEEEEEEDLFNLLQQQRTKQRQLKLRILKTLQKIQKLE